MSSLESLYLCLNDEMQFDKLSTPVIAGIWRDSLDAMDRVNEFCFWEEADPTLEISYLRVTAKFLQAVCRMSVMVMNYRDRPTVNPDYVFEQQWCVIQQLDSVMKAHLHTDPTE
jgi:hypothetical protein